uniref:tRNA (uracil(54)-C(5))-methyltransferase n=1 Tax=Panagrolaimus superbus TaxID=310955 RepID=A0A914Z9E6_9BILA
MESKNVEGGAPEEEKLLESQQKTKLATEENFSTNIAEKTKALEESLRMQIKNLPKFLQFQQLKKILHKHLPSIQYRKLKICEDNAYVSFLNVEGLQEALKIFDGFEIKGKTLSTKHVPEESIVERKPQSPKPLKTAKELTTPLADLPYDQQLEQKQNTSIKVALNLKKQCISNGIYSARQWVVENLVKDILPSPVQEHYRNKAEHTCAYDVNGDICVGFVATRLQDKQLTTVPIYDCPHLRKNTLKVNQAFEEYIRKSGLPPFHEFDRKGFWRSLLIRDFLADCMVVVNVFPFEDQELFEKVKKELIEVFMPSEPISTKDFRVTSLYIAVQKNASDESKLEKLAGTPYVYERLFNIKFRISPNTFFQTNTVTTEVLYTAIGDALGLPKPEPLVRLPVVVGDNKDAGKGFILSAKEKEKSSTNDGEEPVAKKLKIETNNESEQGKNGNAVEENVEVAETEVKEENTAEEPTKKRILLLDICCGAGTIGLSLAKRVEKATAQGKFNGIFGLLGVELINEAVIDAELNARDNHLKANTFRYIPGKAEAIFSSLNYFAPDCFKENSTNPELKAGEIVGVLDPPRAGMNDKVIIGCRKLEEMKRLVYVSCDPNAALKNIIDLCRPKSKKYEGSPFTVTSIQPVDMFPLTTHFEWVIQLDR